jgi:hypothetical protein
VQERLVCNINPANPVPICQELDVRGHLTPNVNKCSSRPRVGELSLHPESYSAYQAPGPASDGKHFASTGLGEGSCNGIIDQHIVGKAPTQLSGPGRGDDIVAEQTLDCLSVTSVQPNWQSVGRGCRGHNQIDVASSVRRSSTREAAVVATNEPSCDDVHQVFLADNAIR